MATEKLTVSTSLKFDNLPKLLGQSNYVLWSNVWRIAFKACRWWNIVNGEIVRPRSVSDSKGKETEEEPSTSSTPTVPLLADDEWDIVNNQAHHMLNTSVDHTILPNIVNTETAADAWKSLKDLYGRDTANTTITLLKTVLDRKLKDGAAMHDHLNGFNNDWARLQTRTSNTRDELGRCLQTLTRSNHAKAAFLLVSLPESMNNIIDNLQTKGDLTFEDVHARLLDPSANHSLGNKGEKAYRVEKSGKNKGLKECTWCKKRNFNAKGHTWQECNKLKASKKNDKSTKEDEKVRLASQEITTENSSTFATAFVVSTNPVPSNVSNAWIFDTGCTSHMSHDADAFDSHRPHGGFVKFANRSKGEISGIGIVKLRCHLPGGQMGLAVLNDVLLVPCLRQNLFSWKSVAKRGFSMIGKDEDIILQDKQGEGVLWAKEILESHVIQLVEDVARFSYKVWHQALGHPSVLNHAETDNLCSGSCLIQEFPLPCLCSTKKHSS